MSGEQLPNGMSLGESVEVFLHHLPEAPWVVGQVVGYYDHPTVVIRQPDGSQQVVSSQLDWRLRGSQ